ncbi:cleavage/polyadenylation specificity factor, 25kDa subunit [Tanacetum coccineum]
MTGKFLELVDASKRKKVDIACFQETKWKGSRNREGNQYKLWYSGSKTARNGVGIVLASYLKDKVVQVSRISDRIMMVRLVIEEETVSVISTYAPQVGLEEVQNKVKAKQTRFRELISMRGDEANRSAAEDKYKEAKREAKKAVAKAKGKVYEDLDKRLDSKEGENDIYRIAKSRE